MSLYFHAAAQNALVFGANFGTNTGEGLALLGLKDGAVVPLLNGQARERNAERSPDGRWMAYQSDESGREEIYVRPFPNATGDRVSVSTDGAVSRSGREMGERSSIWHPARARRH